MGLKTDLPIPIYNALTDGVNGYFNDSENWNVTYSNSSQNQIINPNNGSWAMDSSTTMSGSSIIDVDPRESIEDEIKNDNGNNVKVLGTIFLMDGYIYLNTLKNRSIKLGKFGDDEIGKEISKEVTKKSLKE